jgi:branched-chain amino acid transport system substrate-binding protein
MGGKAMHIRILCVIACYLLIAGTSDAVKAQTPDHVVKIGVLTDMTGLYSDVNGPGSLLATQMAIEDYNAGGGSLKAEAVVADHQNKPDVGAAAVRHWFDLEGVDAVVDVPNSAVALAVTDLAKQYNKVFLNSGASSSDFTGKACSLNSIHWTYDTYALATGTAKAVVDSGGDSWFLIVADYAFGHTMEDDVRKILASKGAQVLGSTRAPLNTPDFSSFLLQAQASKAKVIGLINAGGDTINSVKQAAEFGIAQGGQRLAAMVLYITDVHALGLPVAKGLQFSAAFYWDLNEQTRAWSDRFAKRLNGKRPTQLQAGAYAATLHYLRAVEKAGWSDGKKTVAQMKAMPADDPLFGKGSIREDGRTLHNMYLFEVKTPEASKGPWDYYKLIRTVPATEAFRSLTESVCPYIKKRAAQN